MPQAIVALGESKRIAGRLRFEAKGRRQHSQFEYSGEWLAAKDSFALSPGLPLSERGHFSSGKHDRRDALPGCFSDAAPDSWGRMLMAASLGDGLSEYDYLVLSDDRTRQGALRFLGEKTMEPLSSPGQPIPRIVDLERIRMLAHRLEEDPAGARDEARELFGMAGASGGARPKANIEDGGCLWLGKLTSGRDTRPVEHAEVATLKLASKCGLNAPEARLELRDSDSPIALIRRFDRKGSERIPYMSARTALDRKADEGGLYSDIADAIRNISSEPADDLHELWRRIVFTVLVTNTDDHLKNHGFIYAGGDRWRLSPVFDVNPMPARARVHETGIIAGKALDLSLDQALEAAHYCGVNAPDARMQAQEMATTIAGNWKKSLRDEGTPASGIEIFRDAFEHTESEKALSLVS